MSAPKLELVYFNAGGGHRAAATALEAALRHAHPDWHVQLTNVMEVLDPDAYFKRVTGMAPEDYYNKRLATGFTLGLAQELRIFQGTLRILHGTIVRLLEQHWLGSEPDLVVSLIPNLNRPMAASLAACLPGVPYVTVMTDLADHPPDFWMVPDQPQHIVCGTERAEAQARGLGYPTPRVHRVSGMILRPAFYAQHAFDRAAERRSLGLDEDRPTGVVLFGGHGSSAMLDVARELSDVQLIMLCGHNARLARRLRERTAAAPRAILGFTRDVPRFMRMADFFVGKPGPGSISEAVHHGLPVVTVRNAWTMPQERYNTEWVRSHGLGIASDSFRRLRRPVSELLARLPEYTARVRAMPPNRAVFEVVALLESLLAGAPPDGSPEQGGSSREAFSAGCRVPPRPSPGSP